MVFSISQKMVFIFIREISVRLQSIFSLSMRVQKLVPSNETHLPLHIISGGAWIIPIIFTLLQLQLMTG